MSVLWSRLWGLTRERRFAQAAERVNAFLMRTHDRGSGNGGLRGGIRGSFPVNGAYCRYLVPNWAAKFFVDALLFAPSHGRQAEYPG
jgi:hypothetical protein